MDETSRQVLGHLIGQVQAPAAEYCLLTGRWWWLCLTKSEWAAWVQAVGSLVALAVAIWLSGSSERAAFKQARSNSLTFAGYFASSVEGLLDAAKRNNSVDLALRLISLRETAEQAKGIRIDLLPLPVLAAVAAIQGHAGQLAAVVDGHLAGRIQGINLHAVLKDSASRANEQLSVIDRFSGKKNGGPVIELN